MAALDRFASVLEQARAGDPLSAHDAQVLLNATVEQLPLLLGAAGAMRDEGLAAAGRPGIITYSRKVFVPLTTLCRDRCHYCIFVDTPGQLLRRDQPLFMSEEQVLALARQGRALGCKEALLTLGDRPEDRWPQARAWLTEHGYDSTLDYVAAMARLITTETGLLAHLNPGVMRPQELARLRACAPSMGMMLETTSERLHTEPGQVHFGSPDKDPAVRLKVLQDAGAARVPFTTGILVGIGETVRDRAESLLALREVQARHGHLQEVIVQNFRAKPKTAMQAAPDAELTGYLATIATARLVLGPSMRVQAPPNLSDTEQLRLLLAAGVDDWGGVSPLTADHVNPERPWPHLDDLADATRRLGFTLRERLTAHPEYIADPDRWIDPGLHRAVADLSAADGLAAEAAPATVISKPAGERRLLSRALTDPADLDDHEWAELLCAEGSDLDALTHAADEVRRYTVGAAVSLVVNRNLTSSGLRAAGHRGAGEFDLRDAAEIASDAAALGATEVCIQGRLPDTEDPMGYCELARAVLRGAPDLHLHAYRPQDVWDLADRAGLGLDDALGALRDAGVRTVPGTGVKVLSERVRALIAPQDVPIERWAAAVETAHRMGLRSSSVLFYGHVETAIERVAHLRQLREIQSRTGGFSEFVPIPLPGGDVPLVAGRSPLDEHRAMVAVSRLLLTGAIAHIQIPWTRLGLPTTLDLLRAGGDDLGGTLLDGRVLPDTGAEHGLELPVDRARRACATLMRPFRLRTTDYGTPPGERIDDAS